MSNLITFQARRNLWNHLEYSLTRFYIERKGSFTFQEILDFREKLRNDAIERYSKNGVNRIPQYIWQKFYGATDILFRFIENDTEGGYRVFGKFYRHPGKSTSFPQNPTWQDLCPNDPIFRQTLLRDSYVWLWKSTGKIYSGKTLNEELPILTFYKEADRVMRFNMKKEDVQSTGTEPFNGMKEDYYKKIWNIMDFYCIPMENVEEL